MAVAADLINSIDAWAGTQVLVLGESMLDIYLRGSARRLSPEAPVPVVDVVSRAHAPGGAANAALNIAALGGTTTLLSVVGNDVEGGAVRQTLVNSSVDVEGLLVGPTRQTLTKQRLLAGSHMVVRFDEGTTEMVDAQTEQRLIDYLTALWPSQDAVLVSDYDYGVITPCLIGALVALQERAPRPLVLDSKRLAAFRCTRPTAVKPNFEQVLQLLGGRLSAGCASRATAVLHYADEILDITDARIAAVTLDCDGGVVLERGRRPHRTHTRATPHPTTAGAGDTFAAAFALGLAAGIDSASAADLAAAAAAIVIERDGTSACSAQELRASVAPSVGLWDLSRLADEVERQRERGHRVVLTNGCFDVLHSGHVDYLSRARTLGDVLVVGLNSDAGVRRLKGPDRPVSTLEDRARVLSALSCVDRVVAFDEDTPVELVRRLRPDVFVKGGDYTLDMMPEAPIVEELGGEVRILPLVKGRSTTGIVQKIRGSGAESLVG